jgi:hypothetical protein
MELKIEELDFVSPFSITVGRPGGGEGKEEEIEVNGFVVYFDMDFLTKIAPILYW